MCMFPACFQHVAFVREHIAQGLVNGVLIGT